MMLSQACGTRGAVSSLAMIAALGWSGGAPAQTIPSQATTSPTTSSATTPLPEDRTPPVAIAAPQTPKPTTTADAQAGTDSSENGDIVVTGIRASLSSAIQQKRNADSIVDTIAAEDIGAFPDTNIAESLQRVTGIQINRARAFSDQSAS